jgi:hypothetical protein
MIKKVLLHANSVQKKDQEKNHYRKENHLRPMRQVMPHVNGAMGAVNKLADMSGALTELSKRLGPLMAFMPQGSKSKDTTSPPAPEAH